MIRNYTVLLIVMIWVLFSAGCASRPSRLEMNYGTSFFLSKFNQTLNPEAEKSLEPVTGLDSYVALENIKNYRKSFEKITKTSAQLTK
ncbi:MAG: hypothetical protein ACMUHX_02215 [bacterium]